MNQLSEIKANYSNEIVLSAFKVYCSNQRLNDKHSLGYKIGMLNFHHVANIFYYHFKRPELLNFLFSMVNADNIYDVVRSDYTATQLLNIINKKK